MEIKEQYPVTTSNLYAALGQVEW